MTRTTHAGPVLSRRTLNRTLLGRQLLLERVERSVPDVVEHLVGMQAQEPLDPYVGLWTRIAGFDPEELSALIAERGAVRMGLQRTTLHLATARDARTLYPVMADVLRRAFRSSPFAKQLVDVDMPALLAAARAALEERPRTPTELGQALASAWPDRDPTSLAYAARFLLPLVQVPPRGLWRQTSRPDEHDRGSLARGAARDLDRRGRGGAALPRRVRPGDSLGYPDLVMADRAARGGGAVAPAAADLPRRSRPRAARYRGGTPRGSG